MGHDPSLAAIGSCLVGPWRAKRETGATGGTREDETSNPSRFSRKSRANNEIRFTNDASRRLFVEEA